MLKYRQLFRMFLYIGLFLLPLTAYSVIIQSKSYYAFILVNALLILPGLFDVIISNVIKLIDILTFHIIKPKIPWNLKIEDEERISSVKTGELIYLIAIAWIITALIFSMIFINSGFSFVDALFETMSGLTTSGLSVMDPSKLSPDLILLRSFLGWVGGLGILGFALSVIRGITGRKIAEIYGIEESNFVSAIRKVFMAYLLLTIISFLIFLYAGFNPFNSINLAMAGISNNGFYPFSNYELTNAKKDALSLVMIIGSISISAYAFFIFNKNIKALINEDLIFYILLIILMVSIFFISSGKTLYSSFHYVITTITTGGFDIANFKDINDSEAFILTIAMLIGGMYLSTAGGIHSSRILLIIKSIIHNVKAMFSESRVEKLWFRGQVVDTDEVIYALSIAFLYMAVFSIFTILFMANGHPFKDSTIIVSSALGNVGVSTMDVAQLKDIEKVYLTFLMYIGRIEILPIIAVFYRIILKIRRK